MQLIHTPQEQAMYERVYNQIPLYRRHKLRSTYRKKSISQFFAINDITTFVGFFTAFSFQHHVNSFKLNKNIKNIYILKNTSYI